jgi:hypothetical protein
MEIERAPAIVSLSRAAPRLIASARKAPELALTRTESLISVSNTFDNRPVAVID